MTAHPRTDQYQLSDGEGSEAQRDSEAMLAAADSDKIRKEEQEQYHPNLHHSYAAL